ncbi:MAG: hypothetical protein DMG65_14400, partial [Candidatus Angelobacter sp. Gp1-AA117]
MFESVHQLFSRTASRLAGSTAVDAGRRSITYGELDARSDRIGRALRGAGVSKGVIVGILAGEPIEVIMAIIGTLKAGAVFCPLDPTFPLKRLQVMVEGVQPQFFIGDSRLVEKLVEITSGIITTGKVIVLDGGPVPSGSSFEIVRVSEPAWSSAEALATESQPDDPCSIYFTSGSTGKPKAILGRLKGMDHFARWEAEALGIGEGTRVSQLASPSFDGFL